MRALACAGLPVKHEEYPTGVVVRAGNEPLRNVLFVDLLVINLHRHMPSVLINVTEAILIKKAMGRQDTCHHHSED
jgi:hypothetical protein